VANVGSLTAIGVTDWWLFPLVAGVSFAGTESGWFGYDRGLSIGWLALAIGTANAVMMVCLGVRRLGHWTRPAAPHSMRCALWVGNWLWVTSLLTIATVLRSLLLPDGRLPGRRWSPAMALSVIVVVVNSVDWAVTP
jgi:hypothetical protein